MLLNTLIDASGLLGDRAQYVPLLVGIMVIFSAAIFGCIAPKYIHYYRDLYKDELKDALAIEKSLKERNKLSCGDSYTDPKMEKIISHYKEKYIENRLGHLEEQGINRKFWFEKTLFELMVSIGAGILVIAFSSLGILWLIKTLFLGQ